MVHTSMNPHQNCTFFKEFHEITKDNLIELIKDRNQAICDLDPCSTKLVYKCLEVLKGTLTKMVNLSLKQGLFIQD